VSRAHGIGIVGAGDVVHRFWLPALNRPHLAVRAICSATGAAAAALAPVLGAPSVTADYRHLVARPDVEIVLVCSPPYTHREIAEAALAHDKHVLVEKPVCASYDEFLHLRGAAAQSRGLLSATFNNAWREENEWLRQQVAAGQIGTIELIELEWLRKPQTNRTGLPSRWRRIRPINPHVQQR
jgi:predicted dehydrogenase